MKAKQVSLKTLKTGSKILAYFSSPDGEGWKPVKVSDIYIEEYDTSNPLLLSKRIYVILADSDNDWREPLAHILDTDLYRAV